MSYKSPRPNMVKAAEKPRDPRADRVMVIAHNFFTSEDGEFLLEYFKDQTVNCPVVDFSLPGDMQLSAAARREGRNSIIRELIAFQRPLEEQK